MSDLIIDENNFSQYFRDVLTNKPSKGDVLVCYKAIAELCDGDLKEQVVESLFLDKVGPNKAITLLTKIGKSSRKEAISLIKKISYDLYNGMSKPMVLAKAYEYLFEIYYYSKEEYLPKNDKHWEMVKINNLDEYLDNVKKENDIAICEK